ncbi:MAG TPA: tyrosine-type recombinase/integrase [Bryobacteraceae bacterium]|nr:tyrosine-type recombinase/integrase [Bryobacteraceae bacterium]
MCGSSVAVESLSAVAEQFLFYAQVERGFARGSLATYRDCFRQIVRIIGDRPITEYTRDDVLTLKSAMLGRGLGVCRQIVILSALKNAMEFAKNRLGLDVLDSESIVIPKRPRREVSYLTVEEVERFVSAIRTHTLRGAPIVTGVRFRALVEGLLGSAMRISELLSLDRDRIDFSRREARIIGKGNKERTVFFTVRALSWFSKYLETRQDTHPALFVRQDGLERLKQPDVWRPFVRYRKLAGINKRVTPHLLRHTAATQLLFNGCPIGHIKEILGHERLETTCRYYLGLDHRAAKLAHERYLVYGSAAA